jgi:hypothetical protein
MRWSGHPNLRRRPHAPNAGRGRLQAAVRRAFIAAGGEPVPSSVFYDWSYPGRNRLSQLHRHAVWRVLVKVADPIGRVPPYGAWLWRLKPGVLDLDD